MSRFAAALAALALAAGACAAVFLWQPGLDSLHDDSVSYLVMAQAFSPWARGGCRDPRRVSARAVSAALPAAACARGRCLRLARGAPRGRRTLGASVYLLGLHARNVTASARLGFIAALVYALLPGRG